MVKQPTNSQVVMVKNILSPSHNITPFAMLACKRVLHYGTEGVHSKKITQSTQVGSIQRNIARKLINSTLENKQGTPEII